MNNKILCLLVILITVLSFSVKPESLKTIDAQIREEFSPVTRTLKSLDKAHLNKRVWAEKKMAVTKNVELQKDLHKRFLILRDLIFEYSKKSRSQKSVETLKLHIKKYHKNLTRLLAIFFHFHHKFGGFPTMKQVRALNPHIHVDAFVQIADLVRMKARHISDEKIEILVKEMEYIQIASSVYTSNVSNGSMHADYAHLVQFMATQKTLINRGQLSQMDNSGRVVEKNVAQCMPRNLYIGDSKNFVISEHALNTEDKMVQFYDNFMRNIGDAINEVAGGEFSVNAKIASRLANKIVQSEYAKNYISDQDLESLIDHFSYRANSYIFDNDNFDMTDLVKLAKELELEHEAWLNLPKETARLHSQNPYDFSRRNRDRAGEVVDLPHELNVSIFGQIGEFQSSIKSFSNDKNEESRLERKRAAVKFMEGQIAVEIGSKLNMFLATGDIAKKLNIAFLNGDDVSKEQFISRARRYVEIELNKGLVEYIKSIIGDKKSYVNKRLFASEVSQIMNHWEGKLKKVIDQKVPDFSLASINKTKLDKFVEGEFYKALPYMKSIFFTRFVEKNGGSNLWGRYSKHPYKDKLTFAPDSLSEIKSLDTTTGAEKKSLAQQVFLDGLYSEISSAYSEMIPYIELINANPNDHFYSENGLVKINYETLDKRVSANIGEFAGVRNYAVDMKYRPYLNQHFMGLKLYADSGDKNYLSRVAKKYLASHSGHRGGRFSPATAKEILKVAGDENKLVKNTTKSNPSIKVIIDAQEKLSIQKQNLLWNIMAWKIGEYFTDLGLSSDDIKRAFSFKKTSDQSLIKSSQQSIRIDNKNAYVFRIPQFTKKLNLVEPEAEKGEFSALPSTISGYVSETVVMTSFYDTTTPSAPIPFRREELSLAKNKLLSGNPYSKVLTKLLVRLKMVRGFLQAKVAKGEDGGLFDLNVGDYKKIAETRVNELYAFSSLLRTPYKLGTSGETSPTAFRLMKAYDITSNDPVKPAVMKETIKETVYDAMANSSDIAEKWCGATYSVSSGPNDKFKHLFRNSPLIRQELMAEVQRIEERRGSPFGISALVDIDERIAKMSKTTGEKIHDAIELASMIVGIILLVALALTGVGAIGSAAIFGMGTSALAVTMNQVIFLFFAISFGSRMHHIYFRVPAALGAQYKVASTQVIKTLYSDWDDLEEKIKTNKEERTSTGSVALHIGEGIMNTVFAYHALKVPFVRYSGRHMAKIFRKSGLHVNSILKPMKPVRLHTNFRWSSVKGNWKSFRNGLDNMANKILKRRDYLIGANAKQKAELLEKVLKYRISSSLGKNFNRESLVKLRDVLKRELELLKLDKGIPKIDLAKIQKSAGDYNKALDDLLELTTSIAPQELSGIKGAMESYIKSVKSTFKLNRGHQFEAMAMNEAKTAYMETLGAILKPHGGMGPGNFESIEKALEQFSVVLKDFSTVERQVGIIAELKTIAGRSDFEKFKNFFSKTYTKAQHGYLKRRAFFKSFREGNLAKYRNLRSTKGHGVDSFQEALEQLSMTLKSQKLAANESMLMKIEDALEFKSFEVIGETKIFDELSVLFGNGEGAFNQAESMAFLMKVMTSTKVGSIATKYRLLKAASDYGVLTSRAVSLTEHYLAKEFPESFQEARAAYKAYEKSSTQMKRLMDEQINSAQSGRGSSEAAELFLTGEVGKGSRYFKIPTFKKALDGLEKFSMTGGGKAVAISAITLYFGGPILWKEANFYYQILKDKYYVETGEEFQGPEFIESSEELDRIIDGDESNIPWSEAQLEEELESFEELARPVMEAYEETVEESRLLEQELNGIEHGEEVLKLGQSINCREKEYYNCTPDATYIRTQTEQLEFLNDQVQFWGLDSLSGEVQNLSLEYPVAN